MGRLCVFKQKTHLIILTKPVLWIWIRGNLSSPTWPRDAPMETHEQYNDVMRTLLMIQPQTASAFLMCVSNVSVILKMTWLTISANSLPLPVLESRIDW